MKEKMKKIKEVCKRCGFEHFHIISVKFIKRINTLLDNGSLLILNICCEDCGKYVLSYKGHKGEVFSEINKYS